jgi:hypothetical protein
MNIHTTTTVRDIVATRLGWGGLLAVFAFAPPASALDCEWSWPYACWNTRTESCSGGGTRTVRYVSEIGCSFLWADAITYCSGIGSWTSWDTHHAPASDQCRHVEPADFSPGSSMLNIGTYQASEWPFDALPADGDVISLGEYDEVYVDVTHGSGTLALYTPREAAIGGSANLVGSNDASTLIIGDIFTAEDWAFGDMPYDGMAVTIEGVTGTVDTLETPGAFTLMIPAEIIEGEDPPRVDVAAHRQKEREAYIQQRVEQFYRDKLAEYDAAQQAVIDSYRAPGGAWSLMGGTYIGSVRYQPGQTNNGYNVTAWGPGKLTNAQGQVWNGDWQYNQPTGSMHLSGPGAPTCILEMVPDGSFGVATSGSCTYEGAALGLVRYTDILTANISGLEVYTASYNGDMRLTPLYPMCPHGQGMMELRARLPAGEFVETWRGTFKDGLLYNGELYITGPGGAGSLRVVDGVEQP